MRLFGWLRSAAVAPRQVLAPRLEMPPRQPPAPAARPAVAMMPELTLRPESVRDSGFDFGPDVGQKASEYATENAKKAGKHAKYASGPAAPAPALTAAVESGLPPSFQPRDWSNIDVQGQLLAEEAKRSGRTLTTHHPRDHAERLLLWCQQLVAAGAVPSEMMFDDVRTAYLEMCFELGWRVASWVTVGRHFAKITGGKKYRNARDPQTGLMTAKERIYRIRGAVSQRGGARVDRQGAGLRLAHSQQQLRLAA